MALIADAVDDYVAFLEEEREPDGYWHPSSLFTCARRAVYEFLGTEKPPLDPKSKRIFRLGHMLHEFVQTALAGVPGFYSEVKVYDPELKLKGHADGIIVDGKQVEIIEIKTISTYGWKALTEPKPEHVKQAMSYARTLRRFGGEYEAGPEPVTIPGPLDVTRIRFIYLSKDNLDPKEYTVDVTPADEQELEEYIERLDLHVFEGTLPRRLVNITPTGRISKTRPWECGYCPFAQKCWSPREPEGIA